MNKSLRYIALLAILPLFTVGITTGSFTDAEALKGKGVGSSKYGSSTDVCGLQLCSEIPGGKAAWMAEQGKSKTVVPVTKEKDDHMKEIDLFIKQNDLYNAKISVGKWAQYSDLGKLIEKGIIQHADRGKDLKEIKPILENEGELIIGKLERRLSVLATISGVAPMLGLSLIHISEPTRRS